MLAPWITRGLAIIANAVKKGEKIPAEWLHGAHVHIYKNKGNPDDCNSYRPICLTQIIYKIWPQLITRKIAKILHILTSNNQYGYKGKLSTIDAIMKVEENIQNATADTSILLGQTFYFVDQRALTYLGQREKL